MIPVIALDLIDPVQGQPEVTFNELANACSRGALFGVKKRETVNLRLTVYGGNFGSPPVALPDQTVNLTPSATNYVSADPAGILDVVTSAPTGWPGRMPSGDRGLYQLTVGADSITSGTSYVTGIMTPGPDGGVGAVGAQGADLGHQRKRVCNVPGAGSSTIPTDAGNIFGFTSAITAGAGGGARTLASTSLGESIPYVAVVSNSGAGQSAQVNCTTNFCFRGNAAGRGGFDVSMRWYQEQIFAVADERFFFGLFDVATGVIGNVQPDTLTNIVGVGSLAGDANLSVINNDGSGTATMATLGSNFPARTAKVYELRLWCDANASGINYSITNVDDSQTSTGTLSSDIPANTQFLAWCMWVNTGSTGGSLGVIGFMQVVAYTRY